MSNQIDQKDTINDKLNDAASTPGFQTEFNPEEAELAGAFFDDALSEQEASESSVDLVDSDNEKEGTEDEEQ